MRFPKWMRFAASGLIGATILALTVNWIGVGKLLEAMAKLDPAWLILIIMLNLCVPFLRAARWKLLLNPVGSVGFKRLAGIVILGSLANAVAPIRAGEFLRAILVSAGAKLKFTPSLSSIFAERVLDVLTLLSFAGGIAALTQLPLPTQFLNPLRIVGILFAVLIAFIILMVKKEGLASRLLNATSRLPPKRVSERLSAELKLAVKGVSALGGGSKAMVPILFSSIAVWGVPMISTVLLFKALSMDTPANVVALGYTLHCLSFAIPAPPGYAGTFELYWALIYSSLGVNFGDALAAGLIAHTIWLFVSIVLGGAALLIGIDLKELMNTIKRNLP